MLFTPGHFSRRADLYHQLGQLTAAGLGIMAALQQLQRSPPARDFKSHLASVSADVAAGYSLSESFARCPDWLPQFDLALLHAGERSGRLDATFQLLAAFYQDRAAMARKLLGALAYPAFLLHFAIFILPFAELFNTGNVVGYLLKTIGVLGLVYVLVVVGVFVSQGNRGAAWRNRMEQFTAWIPLVGMGRRQLALARLAAALEALISAGETIHEAWPLAAGASGSPALQREVASWQPRLAAGSTPAELLQGANVFPEMFSNLYSTGEISGKLDETLTRLHRYYADEGSRHLHAAAKWAPSIVYGFIAAYIAWRVIQFWTGYFNQINQVMDGN